MDYYTQSMTLLGRVTEDVDPASATFCLRCRNKTVFTVKASAETFYTVLQNLHSLNYDRVRNPLGRQQKDLTREEKVRVYIRPGELVFVQGILLEHGGQRRLDARAVTLMHYQRGQYLFEDTHWWLTQIALMADEWLDDLFQDRRSYQWDDFAALYRTNLNILGQATDDTIQECATLSRLIYGLSSAYLLTGGERYLLAARAGVKYQRETFRNLSHDGQYCFWMFGKRKRKEGAQLIVASENPDDAGTLPLYEQIYALAGLTQYYRITQEWEALEDIRRTVKAFQDFYRDSSREGEWPRTFGYFSHLDYATMRPDTPALGDNRLKKNWNSIGDHIPAYLVNLILALDPIPLHVEDRERTEALLETCKGILDETSRLILEEFPDRDPNIPYVNERFNANWTPDHDWRWQKNRAIVGHNLKIAWNLTRVASYYSVLAQQARDHGKADEADEHDDYTTRLMELATRLGDAMKLHGIDQLRGGCFDAVERAPSDNMPIEFTWGNTKDFWQQEQAILAYLILHGWTNNSEYLDLARETMAFWNQFFLDHDNRGVFFRVNDAGMPVLQGAYGHKAGHAVAGYHAFELNYLAHIYIRSYVATQRGDEKYDDRNFVLFFRPDRECGRRSVNVLPDFVRPGTLEIASITVNGAERTNFDPDNFRVELADEELGASIRVEFRPKRRQS